MFKTRINHRVVVSAGLQAAKIADANIKGALLKWREDLINEAQKILDDQDTWTYPYEHVTDAAGRSGGSEVREEHGSQHFKFSKAGNPLGYVPYYDMILEDASPEYIGTFLLEGTAPHEIQAVNSNQLVWDHEYSGLGFGSAQRVMHPGSEGKAELIGKLIGDKGMELYGKMTVELNAIGNGIFRPIGTYSAYQSTRFGGSVTNVGEPSVRDVIE
jgi:hypothetical protein